MSVPFEELATISDPVGDYESNAEHLLCHAHDETAMLWGRNLRLNFYESELRLFSGEASLPHYKAALSWTARYEIVQPYDVWK